MIGVTAFFSWESHHRHFKSIFEFYITNSYTTLIKEAALPLLEDYLGLGVPLIFIEKYNYLFKQNDKNLVD